ncbi:PQQ-binding-like beta-propeller repeat protein [Streptomyces sp. MB09-02B]|uniref:outer membrane protein assembly factor BamB family protein n=1 Tax=Streptomyces sp. MB09-02B TaxID=3028667 RepID=UPI0029B90D17|nr:PQQ-binding-like beta-propeller repeat protein [Streptomyces sp. MB09-02B]MDX3639006.1 PQQ-binding-like beta-propeller repeat protein [Streptomyces sp. MB09-02B]
MSGPFHSPYTASALASERRTRLRRLRTAGAAVLAAAVVAVGILGLRSGGDDVEPERRPVAVRQAPDDIRETVEKAPESPEGGRSLYLVEKIKTVGRNISSIGTWATEKVFAKGVGDYVQGFTQHGDKSKELYKLDFPAPLCAVTRHVSVAGWTAVAYPGQSPDPDENPTSTAMSLPCDRLAVFDVDTGRKRWDVRLPGDGSATSVNVTMTNGAVLVTWGQGSAAYDMTTGKRLWADTTPSACEDSGFAGGRGLIALQRCGDSGDPEFRVEKVDARTGKSQWTYKVATGVNEVYLISSEPAVIAVMAGGYAVTDLISLDDRGKARASIQPNRDHQVINCSETFNAVVETCSTIVVGKERLYITTDDDIVAYDLGTGRTVFKFDSIPGRRMYPLRMSGGELIAYREAGNLSPAAVVSLDPVSRKETLLLLIGGILDLGAVGDPTEDDIIYEHGRIYFATETLYGPSDKGEVGEETTVAIGYESVALDRR